MLEAYYESISVYSEIQGESSSDNIRQCITKMEKICQEHGLQSHYITQAKTMLAIDIFNHNMKDFAQDDSENPLERKKRMCEEPVKIL